MAGAAPAVKRATTATRAVSAPTYPARRAPGGANLQQYECHTGTNQRFDFSLWGDSAGGWKVRPLSGLSANLCLGVEGGSSPSAAPLEQRSCGGSWDQRWFLRWL